MHGHSLFSFLVSLRILQPLVIFSSVISFLGGESWPFSRSTECCLSQSRAQTQHTCPAADVPQIETVAEQGWTCHSLKQTKLLEWGTQHFKKNLLKQCPRSDSLQDPTPGQRAWQLQQRKSILNVFFISGLSLLLVFFYIATAHTELSNIKIMANLWPF